MIAIILAFRSLMPSKSLVSIMKVLFIGLMYLLTKYIFVSTCLSFISRLNALFGFG